MPGHSLGGHAGRLTHEDGAPSALPRHRRRGRLRHAGLPVVVLLHRLRRRAGRRRQERLRRRCTRAGLRLSRCPVTSTSSFRSRLDRHHLCAGAHGTELRIHDPAHRRTRPGPGARLADPDGRGLCARSLRRRRLSCAAERARAAVTLKARFGGGRELGRTGAWLKDRANPATAARSTSPSTSSAPRPKAGSKACASSSSTRQPPDHARGRTPAPASTTVNGRSTMP